MRTVCRFCVVSLILLMAGAASPCTAQSTANQVGDVKVVKYAELGQLVKQNKGKVIVVDFWGTFCDPCIREMPNLVRMQKNLPPQDFAAILVSVDDNFQDPQKKEKLTRILRAKNVRFTSWILDEPGEVWQKKLRSDTVPIVFVFNREGKWVKEYTDEKDKYVEIDKLVADLLKK